jgi:hypothetical protein
VQQPETLFNRISRMVFFTLSMPEPWLKSSSRASSSSSSNGYAVKEAT